MEAKIEGRAMSLSVFIAIIVVGYLILASALVFGAISKKKKDRE